jgi:hypothetical protein
MVLRGRSSALSPEGPRSSGPGTTTRGLWSLRGSVPVKGEGALEWGILEFYGQ